MFGVAHEFEDDAAELRARQRAALVRMHVRRLGEGHPALAQQRDAGARVGGAQADAGDPFGALGVEDARLGLDQLHVEAAGRAARAGEHPAPGHHAEALVVRQHGEVVSPGFAILSTLGKAKLDAWIAAHDFSRFTANTITDAAVFRDTVAATGRLGYSFVNQYIDAGLGGIAAALFDRHGHCVGAISMTFQTQRHPDESVLTQLLPALQDVVKVLREVI